MEQGSSVSTGEQSAFAVDAAIGKTSLVAQYKDGMNLYAYVAGNAVMFLDPQGTDIYLKSGNNTDQPIQDQLHQYVCADFWSFDANGCPRRTSFACFSYAGIGVRSFGPSLEWLGWALAWYEGSMEILMGEGVIYRASDNGTVVVQKKTTPIQDNKWIKWMNQFRVGTKDKYSPWYYNCRKYSQMEYADAPGNHPVHLP